MKSNLTIHMTIVIILSLITFDRFFFHFRRSKSPGHKKPPEELAQHFKYVYLDSFVKRNNKHFMCVSKHNENCCNWFVLYFRYVEPEPGLSEDQLRDIPYTAVE